MALPERVRVKLSSEAAEAISLTRVIVQEMPLSELIDVLLGVAGKDHERVRELLLRGTVVSGASRYRWDGWSIEPAELAAILASYPDPDPGRPFDPHVCTRAVLRDDRGAVEVAREAASRKGLFRRSSFWDRLLDTITDTALVYKTYSYRDRADLYEAPLAPAHNAAIREAAPLLTYTTLRQRMGNSSFDTIDLFTSRGASAVRPR
jgi:hypothetical protein